MIEITPAWKPVVEALADVARRDVTELLRLAAEIPIRPEIQTYPLEEANKAWWS